MNVAFSLISNKSIPGDVDQYGTSTYWFQNADDASEDAETTVEIATEAWYGEGEYYDFTGEPVDVVSTSKLSRRR